MPADTFDITLTALAYGGDALGRLPDSAPRLGRLIEIESSSSACQDFVCNLN